jgi:hypothetical protein
MLQPVQPSLATAAASGASGAVALALAALSRTPPPPAAARCVANEAAALHPQVFSAVRALALERYLARTPSAVRAVALLQGRGCALYNDHVALRSFADPSCGSGLAFLEGLFLPFGYAPQDALQIPGLPLNARWYEPPASTGWPKVFISELRVAELPARAAQMVRAAVGEGYLPHSQLSKAKGAALEALDAAAIAQLMEEPPWRASFSAADEAALRALVREEGAPASALEYTAWTLTHAHRWNHLTLLVNTFGREAPVRSLAELNALLIGEGFHLNPAGGTDGFTQGSAAKKLEQSSTVADSGKHTFGCGTERGVPTAFLELIERHAGFRGFLGDNARGIFDSTSTAGRAQ